MRIKTTFYGPLLWAMAFVMGSLPAWSADVVLSVDTRVGRHAISPFIYGYNTSDSAFVAAHGVTLTRSGGNRWTAYNWENNASNAGADWYHQNDGYLCSDTPACNQPGEAVRRRVQNAFNVGASTVVTIPIQGYVAADKNGGGDVNQTPDYLNVRFKNNEAHKGSAYSLTPDVSDDRVYQDEFVNWLETAFPNTHSDQGPQIFYCLDNEPALWPSTHARIHPAAPTYAEMATRSVTYAGAIKEVAANAWIFGPVAYGWAGWDTLQEAPDAAGRNFLDFYLDTFQAAETASGQRLLDVVDLHWYPEARGGGVRITETSTDPAVVVARLQAPRSLWDPTYTEDSWIAEWMTSGPIRLLPRIFDLISAHYPGTKLAITDYYYGAGHHISGAIAQADALGIFGREGLFAASLWPLADNRDFINAAFAMFRNYDGHGGRFGDLSVHAASDDIQNTSVYASLDSRHKNQLVVVAINKSAAPLEVEFQISADKRFRKGTVYQLTSTSVVPQVAADIEDIPATNTFTYEMPAYSVSTLALTAASDVFTPVMLLLL